MPCDQFFEDNDIPYEPDFADVAVFQAHRQSGKDQIYAKWLIMCWFDTTYGAWDGPQFNQDNSRDAMRDFLARTAYDTFEDLLADPNYGGTRNVITPT